MNANDTPSSNNLTSNTPTNNTHNITHNITHTTFAVDLDHQALLSIKGPDACKFLQGQVTCDLYQTDTQVMLGAHCNHKGRIIFSFLAQVHNPEHITLRLPTEQLELARTTLGKYIVFSKAEISIDTRQKIGVWGSSAQSLIEAFSGIEFSQTNNDKGDNHPTALSFHSNDHSHANDTFIQLHSDRYECWLSPESYTQLTHSLTPQYWQHGADKSLPDHSLLNKTPSNKHLLNWQLLDMDQGIVHVQPATVGLLIPQMLNYQHLGGISFTKGCYTGQEVVARMQYHGKLKRHLHRAQLHSTQEDTPLSAAAPNVGDPVYSTKNTSCDPSSLESSCGFIVAFVNTIANTPTNKSTCDTQTNNPHGEILMVITDKSAQQDNLYLNSIQPQRLQNPLQSQPPSQRQNHPQQHREETLERQILTLQQPPYAINNEEHNIDSD